jgi:hypothetical protein
MVRSAYRLAVGQKWVTAAEFWALCPGEYWWLVDAYTRELQTTDFDSLVKLFREAQAND